MRLDHILIHVDRDAQALRALKAAVNAQGYPYEPESGRSSLALRSTRINVGDEYLEIVQLFRRGAKPWIPQWSAMYDAGRRGAACLFFEVEDANSEAVTLRKAGLAPEGPEVIRYPAFGGLFRARAPYSFYHLPAFPGTGLHLALMQYNSPAARTRALNALTPNAQRSGVNGIRRLEVALPDLPASLPLLRAVFPELEAQAAPTSGASPGGACWEAQAGKTRLVFFQAEPAPGGQSGPAALRLAAITSQRTMLGKQFRVEDVEVITMGG